MKSTVCRSCKAPIYWAMNGKTWLPVDRDPVAEGPLLLAVRTTEKGKILVASPVKGMFSGALVGRNRYVSHFSTCPNAKQHSRRGKR